MGTFRDTCCRGDTVQRAIYLLDPDTQQRRTLAAGTTATYTARAVGGSGAAVVSATTTAAGGETRLAPFVDTANVPVGTYDAWLHLHAADGTLEATVQGHLEVRERAT